MLAGNLVGLCTLRYLACWPDRSCHDGLFQFSVERDEAATYQDLTGRDEVEVSLADFAINPANIRISKGTTVEWVNDDQVPHYVNTDPHAGHSYFPDQNSTELQTGDTFRLTFDQTGWYPYHCSAHPETMTGTIV